MSRVCRRASWVALLFAGVFALLFGWGAAALGPDDIAVGPFSRAVAGGALPEGWRPQVFARVDRETAYALVEDDGVVVVRADSDASASGLIRPVDVDLATHPILTWRWKVANVLAGGDVRRKQGDDYPARLYVAFAYDPERASLLERMEYAALRLVYGDYPPVAALNYIWASNSPVGEIVPNPYSGRARMIVVESGDERVGSWREERRDLAADFAAAFGEAPPRVAAIAIMTDTDDTGESAVAWFGDIVLHARSGSPGASEASEAGGYPQ